MEEEKKENKQDDYSISISPTLRRTIEQSAKMTKLTLKGLEIARPNLSLAIQGLEANRLAFVEIGNRMHSYTEILNNNYLYQISQIMKSTILAMGSYNYNYYFQSIAETMRNTFKQIDYSSIFQGYKDMLSSFDFDNVIFNKNGTIEYEGEVFDEKEIEETSNEIITDLSSNNSINFTNNTIIKKIIVCIIIVFGFSFLSQDDLSYCLLAIAGGFLSQPGADIFTFFKEKFTTNYGYKAGSFKEHCGLINIDEVSIREKPSKNSKEMGKLYYSWTVNIIERKPYWAKIEYKNVQDKIHLSGWVSIKSIKQFNKRTSQFEDINV